MNSKPFQSILIKPSGADCNMNCSYCFYLSKKKLYPETKVPRMKENVLEELMKQVMKFANQNIAITWQGGEPTLLGIDFFQKVIDLQIKYGKNINIGNAFQTNGLLLNEKWTEFLDKYKFLVGLSIDGEENVHNYYRKDKAGNGTWERVYKNAKMLLRRGIAVNSLSCVTDYSAKFAEETYYFLRNTGFTFMQFIPVVETDRKDDTKAAFFSVDAEQYGEFLCRIFDCWRKDFSHGMPTVSVRFFDEVFYHYVGLEPSECTLKKECGVYLVVEHTGDIYSCDFFVEPKWHLGNILNNTIPELLNSSKQKKFGQKKANVDKQCKSCKWLSVCNGGCLKDRLRDPQDNGHNHFCKSFKMFFEHADSFLKELAEKWKAIQAKQSKNYYI